MGGGTHGRGRRRVFRLTMMRSAARFREDEPLSHRHTVDRPGVAVRPSAHSPAGVRSANPRQMPPQPRPNPMRRPCRRRAMAGRWPTRRKQARRYRPMTTDTSCAATEPKPISLRRNGCRNGPRSYGSCPDRHPLRSLPQGTVRPRRCLRRDPLRHRSQEW